MKKKKNHYTSIKLTLTFSSEMFLCLSTLSLGKTKANEASSQGQQMVFQRVVQQLAVGENIHTSPLSPLINIVWHLTPISKFHCSFIQIFCQ